MTKQIKKTRKKTRKKTLPEGMGPGVKGQKDTPNSARKRRREAAALIADMEQAIGGYGFKNMGEFCLHWAMENQENKDFLVHTYLGQRMTADIDPVQEDILIRRMDTDVRVAEAEASGEGGNKGTQVNILTGGVMAPAESLRLPPDPDKANAIEVEVVSDAAAALAHRLASGVDEEDL